MNIFVLDVEAAIAAKLHCDKHVVKMIVETAQLLCTHLHAVGIKLPSDVPLYKPTHKSHPCALWLHGGRAHFFWLLEFGLWLCAVYTRRYGKTHATEICLRHMAKHVCAKALSKTCNHKVWLRRLAKRGIKPDVVRSCAHKVATIKPPKGCMFGVACMGDDTVPLRRDRSGRTNLVGTYHDLYVLKNAALFGMKWGKIQKPPRRFRYRMGWYYALYNNRVYDDVDEVEEESEPVS